MSRNSVSFSFVDVEVSFIADSVAFVVSLFSRPELSEDNLLDP